MSIEIDKHALVKTGATRQELEEAYKSCLNDPDWYSQTFNYNMQVLGVDRERPNDFIYWMYSVPNEDFQHTAFMVLKDICFEFGLTKTLSETKRILHLSNERPEVLADKFIQKIKDYKFMHKQAEGTTTERKRAKTSSTVLRGTND